jgi:hypothetical protein
MRKLKWALFLPVAQFVVFVILIHWENIELPYLGSLRGLCFAINSPGLFLYDFFLRMAPVRWLPPYILHIRSDHFIFLVGVIFQWYMIGREFDKRQPPKSAIEAKLTTAAVLANLLVIAWGIRLIFADLDSIFVVHLSSYIIDGFIILAWALVLVILPTLRLAKSFRRRGSSPATVQP